MPQPRFPAQMQAFRDSLGGPQDIAAGLIGKGAQIDTPFGKRKLVYADYVASGRALMQVEQFILTQVLPFYANSHTEASHCGAHVTRLRREARQAIATACGAGPDHAVIFAGSGATAGLNRLVALLGAGPGTRVVIGPYEHHSNILPWRESGAEVVELDEAPEGGPDLAQLDRALRAPGRVIVTLSAASNVTGILSDVPGITRLVKAQGALMVWDYAGGGPYLPIHMTPAPDAPIDAVVTSPHKFPGGPGASGVMILRRDAVVATRPTWPGGGTVRFVSSQAHDYLDNLEAREEAGTPNVLGDIRAGLAFVVKDALGDQGPRNAALTRQGLAALGATPGVQVLGHLTAPRLPIFSLRLRQGEGFLNPQLAARMLSDHFGIQARGGCACAGPYAHRLLGVDEAQSAALRAEILAGNDQVKPGFLRFNLSVLMTGAEVDYILHSLARLALDAPALSARYAWDPASALYTARAA
jgi:selenocysteine lyase/cysteine desulfurase